MYKQAMEQIEKANSIYIIGHIRPDGDAIGSMMSMYLVLKNMGKNVKVFIKEYGERYNFLTELKSTVHKVEEDKYDLLICMDSSDEKRLEMESEDVKKAEKIIVFDHHKANGIKGDIIIIDDEAPANCEILYDFYKQNNIEITARVADYLYLGLLTDTGSFNYKRTTSHTYRVAADLIDCGADFVEICKRINDTVTEARLKVVSHIINHTEVYFNGKVRLAVINKEELENLGATENDIEGIVNYLRMIEGTEIAIFVREIDGIYKVSIRTEGNVDGAKIALSFGGGGHIRASGFETDTWEKTKEELLNVIGVELDGEINRNT